MKCAALHSYAELRYAADRANLRAAYTMSQRTERGCEDGRAAHVTQPGISRLDTRPQRIPACLAEQAAGWIRKRPTALVYRSVSRIITSSITGCGVRHSRKILGLICAPSWSDSTVITTLAVDDLGKWTHRHWAG